MAVESPLRDLPDDFTTTQSLKDYAARVRMQGEHAYQTGCYLRDRANAYADGLERSGTNFNTEFLTVSRREMNNIERFVGKDGHATKAR